jgi:GT2 family glycosyltransferase
VSTVAPDSLHLQSTGASQTAKTRQRPRAAGKFLFTGEEKLYIRGVTYGPFHPDAKGCEYRDEATVDRDFAAMARHGINSVRVYTVPHRWLLDAAARHDLWVMVGIPWEQHIAFLDDARRADSIEQTLRAGVRACAGHPAVLGYAIGNEIPASIVRWLGRARVEKFLRRLYDAVKQEDPAALATYVNFPSTEYLELPFLDFVSFNVYLEQPGPFEGYLARMQTIAGNRPLVIAESGLDSRRNGPMRQAEILEWQIRCVFRGGCCGIFTFAWTDEWSRGGFEIEDWDFGITTRDRKPKPALQTIAAGYSQAPFPGETDWPRISVVICSYNGVRTIAQTISEVLRSDYPDFEVIVVNDGSTDSTPQIAAGFSEARLISIPNGGLSAARNHGMRAATGEIVAYIDDDAYPDRHWLKYLGSAFRRTNHVAIGGPNIPPPGDGPIAECVANAPGGPIHVMLTDEIAEHIPGCNFAVRRAALEQIGGFDPVYRAAGDDVDCCWRLQEIGTIGFAPAAVVWHHRRNSLRAYWRQQKGYGKAEALLERKWPQRYNAWGHVTWQGCVYGPGVLRQVFRPQRVYHGTWNSAAFQRLYEAGPGRIQSWAQMPEWYLPALGLAVIAAMGLLWHPLFWFGPVFLAAIALPVAQALAGAQRAEFPSRPSAPTAKFRLYALTTALFVIQPIARLVGRFYHGLKPWRRRSGARPSMPRARQCVLWSEVWRSQEDWMERFETAVVREAIAHRGGEFDDWDLRIVGGIAGNARVRLAVEEHGSGKQLLRWKVQPVMSLAFALTAGLLLLISILAARAESFVAASCAAGAALLLGFWICRDCGFATGTALDALKKTGEARDETA